MSNEIEVADLSIDQLKVILLYLESLIKETACPETLDLAAMRATSRVIEEGLEVEPALELLHRVRAYAELQRVQNPISSMF